MSEGGLPPTRWAAARLVEGGRPSGYAENFRCLVAEGADVDGEARLADALVDRGARILDLGSGMGRVSAALMCRGHDVTAVEPDPVLVAQSRETYPDVEVHQLEALQLSPDEHGPFDLVVAVGNVLVYLAEHTERRVLTVLCELLAPGGRILAGFHPTGVRLGSRTYSPAEFTADVEAAGLVVEHRFGGYQLQPTNDEYTVWILTAKQ